jgi:hypothetical protein
MAALGVELKLRRLSDTKHERKQPEGRVLDRLRPPCYGVPPWLTLPALCFPKTVVRFGTRPTDGACQDEPRLHSPTVGLVPW